ncbi:Transient receptor putative cation channel sub V member 5 [Phlyctochytrium bullatum]|nr:Transient receptor putative cation channel sub V member 5 [Phlyctochytrium bullatum]
MRLLPPELEQTERFNMDPLWGAVVRGDYKGFKEVKNREKEAYMMRFGKDILMQTGPEGETLLRVALLMNSPRHNKIARYLIRKRPDLLHQIYEGSNYAGEHCAHLLVVHRNVELLKEFVNRGADVHNARATGEFFKPSGVIYFGETTLGLAAVMGFPEVVKYLIETVQMDPNLRDHEGNTVLHVLAFWGYFNDTKARNPNDPAYRSDVEVGGIYAYLLAHGADDAIVNSAGMTPLQLAVARGHAEMVHAMLRNKREMVWSWGKASAYLYDLTEIDSFLDPFTMAHAKGALELAIELKKQDVLSIPIFQRILEAKWVMYGRNMYYFTVVRSILYYVLLSTVIALVPNGADYYLDNVPNASRLDFFTTGWVGIIRLLLEGGLVFCNLFTLLEEITQLKRLGVRKYWTGLSSTESIFQLVNIMLVGGIAIFRFANLSDLENMFLGIHAVIGWISLLNLTVGHQKMGTIWLILTRVIFEDLPRFLVLLAAVVIGFGQALWLEMAPYANYYLQTLNTADSSNTTASAVGQDIMEETVKQWRFIWAQLILSYDENLLSVYYEKLNMGFHPKMPVCRIGFQKRSQRFHCSPGRLLWILYRVLNTEEAKITERFVARYAKGKRKPPKEWTSHSVMFVYRDDSELPLRMIASANVKSPLYSKNGADSFSQEPWNAALLKKLDGGGQQVMTVARKKKARARGNGPAGGVPGPSQGKRATRSRGLRGRANGEKR